MSNVELLIKITFSKIFESSDLKSHPRDPTLTINLEVTNCVCVVDAYAEVYARFSSLETSTIDLQLVYCVKCSQFAVDITFFQ